MALASNIKRQPDRARKPCLGRLAPAGIVFEGRKAVFARGRIEGGSQRREFRVPRLRPSEKCPKFKKQMQNLQMFKILIENFSPNLVKFLSIFRENLGKNFEKLEILSKNQWKPAII